MATTYSFQKGKHGGPVGCIFPYFRSLTSNSPLESEYVENIPAGFLRCRGQILNADQYPNLATIIGVGSTCIYKKTGTTLLERNSSGTGGQIQLPDLGSKYITASATPGGYAEDTITNPITNTTVPKAGVGVSLESAAVSNVVSFSYTGNFTLPETNIPISGTIQTTGLTSTANATVFETQLLSHGHLSNISTGDYIASATMFLRQVPRIWFYCQGATTIGGSNAPSGLEWAQWVVSEYGSTASTTHNHPGIFPATTSSSKSARILTTNIAADGITTNVRLNTDNTFKLDYITPKFILCEYLIKF